MRKNKAEYTAQDAPRTHLKITGDGPTDLRTDGHDLLWRCDGASKTTKQKMKNKVTDCLIKC